jgi:hypothetical protein
MVTRRSLPLLASLALVACDLSPVAQPTGGVDAGDAGAGCPQALVVVDSDYTSTNVSVVSPAGSVLSASILSSGSVPPGLSAALSGDVVTPLVRPPSGRLVLLDRTNAAVIWVDPATAKVSSQLSVATGFASNPHDYLEVAPDKAYVTRYATNATPGKQAFDAGGDVLIVDTSTSTITGRIDMTEADDGTLQPRADRMLLVGSQAWVSLERLSADYSTAGDERLVGIDPSTDAKTFTLDLPNAENCGGLALSPSGTVVAVACSGILSTTTSSTTDSTVVLIDATKNPPVELQRFPVAVTLGAPLGPSLAFASETVLVGFVYGDMMPPADDIAFTLDTTTGTVAKLYDSGAAFVLGDVRCTPGCGDLCTFADAQANGLDYWSVSGSTFTALPKVNPDPKVGLPPRGIGEY